MIAQLYISFRLIQSVRQMTWYHLNFRWLDMKWCKVHLRRMFGPSGLMISANINVLPTYHNRKIFGTCVAVLEIACKYFGYDYLEITSISDARYQKLLFKRRYELDRLSMRKYLHD